MTDGYRYETSLNISALFDTINKDFGRGKAQETEPMPDTTEADF